MATMKQYKNDIEKFFENSMEIEGDGGVNTNETAILSCISRAEKMIEISRGFERYYWAVVKGGETLILRRLVHQSMAEANAHDGGQ